MIGMTRKLGDIAEMTVAPRAARKPICTSCSYRYLCGYA
jgi:CRISPR/Cas system-associated exonuclease Cas4 (RecB family)